MSTDQLALPKVLDSIVARSAGVLHVGVVGADEGLDKIVVASYRCYVKNTDVMIAAIPLEIAQQDRTIAKGANVFDVAIQGHYNGDLRLRERNFNYIFRMGPMRAAEYALSLEKVAEKERIVKGTDAWLKAVKDLPENDLKGSETDMLVFDDIFDNVVRVRILTRSGVPESTNIKLVSSAAAQWLANYLL